VSKKTNKVPLIEDAAGEHVSQEAQALLRNKRLGSFASGFVAQSEIRGRSHGVTVSASP
jgi:hypothetical protein